MKRLVYIALAMFACSSQAQDLFVQSDAELTIGSGAYLTSGTDVVNEGRIDIRGNAGMLGLGNMMNYGFFINNGYLELFRNWVNTGTFNTSQGELIFSGGADQEFAHTYLPTSRLTVNKTGRIRMSADSIKITDELSFTEGVLSITESSKLIVESGASIRHQAGSESYFDGSIISRGTGYRIFPVGDSGYYGTFEFLEMTGTGRSTEIEVSMAHEPGVGKPGEDLVGVSDNNRWKIQVNNGSIDHAIIQIDFTEENLEEFANENPIRRKHDSPVLAVADSINGFYHSLGIESIFDTDSITFGIISSSESTSVLPGQSKYFGVGLAPTIDPKGEIYFPNVFSPAASDDRNTTYKVFGELISNTPFQIKIYNRFSTLVYDSNTFEEANTVGWNGVNKTGKEEETGVFYVFVKYAYTYEPEIIHEYSGSILLQR